MDHYLFNRKFTVSKTGLKILRHVALVCNIYCITDMMQCGMSRDYPNKKLSDSDSRISKTKDKFLTPTVVIFFINKKKHFTYFNALMPGSSKRSNSDTYSQNCCLF